MESLLFFGITIVVAFVGAVIAEKYRFPSGAMTGSMLAVMLFNVLTDKAVFYPLLRTLMMIFSGWTIGAGISRSDLKKMPALILPIVIVVISLMGYTSGMGLLISKTSPLSLETALFALVPGGVSDMAAISESLGANTAQVSILQLWRLMSIYIVIPPLFRLVTRSGRTEGVSEKKKEKKEYSAKVIVVSLVCAAVGAFVFSLIGMSAGIIIGAMLGSAGYSAGVKKIEYPEWVKFANKLLSGMYLGSQIGFDTILTLGSMMLPAVLMLAGMTAFVLLCGFVLSKLTKLNFASGLIASTPGGLQEMVFLADDIGADPSQTAVVQTARLFGVYLIFPVMIELLMSIIV